MTENSINTIYLGGVFVALFGSAEILFLVFKVRAEITRKYVHLASGLITLLFPLLIGNHWLVLLLCGSFFVLLLCSSYWRFLPSINAVNRKTHGSILYPIVVYGCYLVFNQSGQLLFFYIPTLILAVCDPIAALVGKNWPKGKYTSFGKTKTLGGSLSFFVAAIIVCSVVLFWTKNAFMPGTFLLVFSVALATTIAEALTHKGYDNLTIPIGALLTLLLFNHFIFPL